MLSTFLRGRSHRYVVACTNFCSFVWADPNVADDLPSIAFTGRKCPRSTSYERKLSLARGSYAFSIRSMTTDVTNTFIHDYEVHVKERTALKIAPKPLGAKEVASLTQLLESPPDGHADFLLDLFENRVPPGVDEAAYVKATWLASVLEGKVSSPLIDRKKAVQILGTMQGGYNIAPLVSSLDDESLAPMAVIALSHTLLMFDSFHDVEEKARSGNPFARQILKSWADAEWFLSRDKVPEKITVTAFKVSGETNTDDLSPAPDAWSRPDIPLHALAMLKNPRDGIHNAPQQILELKEKGFPLAYVGDVVGTGSSRKSATNSILWYMGKDIPFVPNKRTGGVCIGSKIAPIFFNTMEDSGALPLEMDVSRIQMGDIIDIYPYTGIVKSHETGEELSKFVIKTEVLFDEVQAGGRIPLIIGRGLTDRARTSLGLAPSTVFRRPSVATHVAKGFTLAQKNGRKGVWFGHRSFTRYIL